MCDINSKSVCEERTYKELFESHSTAVRNFIYYKSGQLELAEDIMHDSFIKLWENCADIIFDKAKSYLCTVAKRLFLNHIEHKKVVLKFEKKDVTTASKDTPEAVLRAKEFQQALELAISKLPEGQREVFLMNRIDKLPFKMIAEQLGVSQKAIEKRMSNALRFLKEQIIELNTYKI